MHKLSTIEQRIISLLRSVADRMEQGTCDLTADEALQVFLDLRGGLPSDPSNQEHIAHIEEAYGLLSNRLDRLEDKVDPPTTRVIPLKKK